MKLKKIISGIKMAVIFAMLHEDEIREAVRTGKKILKGSKKEA